MDKQMEKFQEILKHFDAAMLVTLTEGSVIHARPMAIVDRTRDGELWFVTATTSGKAYEISENATTSVIMQGDSRYLHIAGHARLVENPQMVREKWQDSWKLWFPEGPEDVSGITLIRFIGDEAEYWDNSGQEGVKFLVKAARAYLRGERLDEDMSNPSQHGVVSL